MTQFIINLCDGDKSTLCPKLPNSFTVEDILAYTAELDLIEKSLT